MNTTAALNNPAKCRYCGMMHGPTCWMLKAIEYHEDGSIKRVEFKTAADYPQTTSAAPSVFRPPDAPANLTGFAGQPAHLQPSNIPRHG